MFKLKLVYVSQSQSCQGKGLIYETEFTPMAIASTTLLTFTPSIYTVIRWSTRDQLRESFARGGCVKGNAIGRLASQSGNLVPELGAVVISGTSIS